MNNSEAIFTNLMRKYRELSPFWGSEEGKEVFGSHLAADSSRQFEIVLTFLGLEEGYFLEEIWTETLTDNNFFKYKTGR